MGAGASCVERASTSLDERLRTMLILRSYNCRPRDWTMQEQFDAFAHNGLISKDQLREALRLSECPRIEVLLDRCLLSLSAANMNTCSSTAARDDTAIPISGLISFIEGGRKYETSGPVVFGSHADTPSPTAAATAAPACLPPGAVRTKAVGIVIDGIPKFTAQTNGVGTMTSTSAEQVSVTDIVDGDSTGLSPRVVPLTPKWDTSKRTVQKPREDMLRSSAPHNSRCSQRGGEGEELEENEARSEGRTEGHCTALVRHLGTALGLGREVYRRRGLGQPVWRKKETLIQERIVQYTTLDEEGKVQELYETEKSQTEVLHMECKRTGEFAHRESTHYESGEAFNGEVVSEETGVEHYVHLRSVDDEYEHLESTLPTRARPGSAGTGMGGAADASGAEHDAGSGAEAGGDEPPACSANTPSGEGEADRGAADVEGTVYDSTHEGAQRLTTSAGVERHGGGQNPQSVPRAGDGRNDSNAAASSSDADGAGIQEEFDFSGFGRDARQYPAVPPSDYHYRSPKCSPRLSPRPARSPYRQEGIGGRESSGRFNKARRTTSTDDGYINTSANIGGLGQESGSDDRQARGGDKSSAGLAAGVDGAGGMTAEGVGSSMSGKDRRGPPPFTLRETFEGSRVHAGRASGVQAVDSQNLDNLRTVRDVMDLADDRLPWNDATRIHLPFDTEFIGDAVAEENESVAPTVGGGASVMFFDNESVHEDNGIGIGNAEGWKQAAGISSVMGRPDFGFEDDDRSVLSSGSPKVNFPLNSECRASEGAIGRPPSSEETTANLSAEYTSRRRDGTLSNYQADTATERDLGDSIGVEEADTGNARGENDRDKDKRNTSDTNAAPFCSKNWSRTTQNGGDQGEFGFVSGGGDDGSHRYPRDAATA